MDNNTARNPLDSQTKPGHTKCPDNTETTADHTEISEAEIRERAFEIYLERGGIDGLDEKDWFKPRRNFATA